jgi:oligopeptide transport system ATP-binding protein
METSPELLRLEDVSVTYHSVGGNIHALDGVRLRVGRAEFVAVVGESGSGKSTLAYAVMGLLPTTSDVDGKIFYKDSNLVHLPAKEWQKFRGIEIGMIFQEPTSSLDPIEKVKRQLGETLTKIIPDNLPEGQDQKKIVNEKVLEWLRKVRISDPESVAERYPFQLSGGMVQRVMIAMALCLNPSLLLADEPTTALDVTTQAQILKLMKALIVEFGTSIILITHDLGVAAQVADRIVVLYAGEVVEEGTASQVFLNPLHPYTRGLLKCYPRSATSSEKLETLPGSVPDLRTPIVGCKFAERCPYVSLRCKDAKPKYIQVEENHYAKCTLFY